MTVTWLEAAKLFAITWISVIGFDSSGLAWAQHNARPFVEHESQYTSNPHFSSDRTVSPATDRRRSVQPYRSSPEWNSYWRAVESSSMPSDADCGFATSAGVDPLNFDFYETSSHPFDSHPFDSRRNTGRRNNSGGELHNAYSRSYRSQMPSLKKVRPDDACYDYELYEPDLFGSYQASDRQGAKSFGGGRGQWFGRYEALLAWPYYSNGHSGLNIESGALTISEPFEYNLIYGNRGVVGWESAKGPGGILQYTDIFAVSQRLSAGVTGGTTSASGLVSVPGMTLPFSTNAVSGQRLEATAREHLTSYRPTVFKRVYFPISTITGGFGFDYTVLRQAVSYSRFADLSSTTPSETLDGLRRFSGIGPSFDIEYHRPIGHTQLAMLGGAQMGVLFGSDRWEVIQDSGLIYQNNSRRVVTNAAVRVGVEWSQPVGSRPDSRIFARVTIEGQNWLNAGNFSSGNAGLAYLSGNFAAGISF